MHFREDRTLWTVTDVGLDNLISVANAIAILDTTPVSPRTERIALPSADGRVLARPISADRDYPPFDKALMDGYAVRAEDAGGSFRKVGEIAAGGTAGVKALRAGDCVSIMTGAPLPPGADAVVPIEWTSLAGEVVTVRGNVRPGHAVAKRATEAKAGDGILPAGARLGPAQISVCAQVGAALVDVFARPRVGVLSTGDEIVAFDTTPVGSQIRNSNSVLLSALVRRYGGQVDHLGHVRDDPAAIAEVLATPGLDAILVTGGMSMGAYDYTPRVMRELGYELAITKLKIKPGKPFVFARKPTPAGKDAPPPFIFGLPGNPVSALVCTVRLVSRLLQRLQGASPEPTWETATLTAALPPNGPREFYQPVLTESGTVSPLAWGGSSDVFTLARANALLIRAADEAALPAGTAVPLLRFP